MKSAIEISDEDVAFFREHGWLRLDAITNAEEVGRLRGIFDRLFSERAGWERGRAFDLVGADGDRKDGTPRLSQILRPVDYAPELADIQFRRNALAVAKRLLGPDAEPWFEHAIYKPAEHGAATPWHQDEAHRSDAHVEYEQLSIWMPLQPATVENGCMKYISGSHKGPILEHRSLNGDPKKPALECIGEFDAAAAEPCPLPAGGAAIHHGRTLHGAGQNTTTETRRAYILAFRGPVRPRPDGKQFPWIAGKRTAATERAEAWKNRGGTIGRAARVVGKFAGDAVRRMRRVFRG
ncbi:MAG: hypothetical protein RL088_3071 [Verrucomicrobiota bacterium]|jgi:ectoine hydroxylase-related dioxygenase (phytanoyl-CoA dioxygenase family)